MDIPVVKSEEKDSLPTLAGLEAIIRLKNTRISELEDQLAKAKEQDFDQIPQGIVCLVSEDGKVLKRVGYGSTFEKLAEAYGAEHFLSNGKI